MSRSRSTGRPPPSPAVDAGELELVWRGKYDDAGKRIRVPPRAIDLAVIEAHGETTATSGELVWGDNLDALDAWLPRHRGRVDLVYIDPPFSTGSDFPVLTRTRDDAGVERVLAQPAYTDRWPGGAAAYLGMLAPRIERIHALLAPHGSLYVHVDPTLGHAVRLLLDEVFGADAFQREIIWRIGWVSGFKTRARNWIRNHDTILFYAKDPARMRFNKVYVPHPAGYVRRAGAQAKAPGMAIDDVWNAGSGDLALAGSESLDSIQIKSFSREKTGYATQKNESLLRRIIAASSSPGDLVMDAFCGAGTTAVVASAMGRRFLACDLGEPAIQLTRARLLRAAAGATWTLATPRIEGDASEQRTVANVEKIATRAWRITAPPVTLQLEIDTDAGATLELIAAEIDARPTLAEQVRDGLAAGVDPVLECAIDWTSTDGILRPTTIHVADPQRPVARRFTSPKPLGSSNCVALQIVDLGFARTRIDIAFDRDRSWRVQAWSSRSPEPAAPTPRGSRSRARRA